MISKLLFSPPVMAETSDLLFFENIIFIFPKVYNLTLRFEGIEKPFLKIYKFYSIKLKNKL
jgi:hypothetical protein